MLYIPILGYFPWLHVVQRIYLNISHDCGHNIPRWLNNVEILICKKRYIENLGWLYAHRTLARAPVEPSTLSLHAIMRRPPEWNVTKSPIMLSITGKTDKDDNHQLCFPPAWDVRWSSNQHCLADLLKPVLRASVKIRKGSERAV